MILAPEFRESRNRGTRGELRERTTTTFHGCHIFLQDRWSTIYVRVTKNARKSRIILERRSDSAPRSGQLAKLVCPEAKNGSSLHPPLLGTWKSRHTTRRSGKGQEQPRMKFLEILNESRYRGCISKFTPPLSSLVVSDLANTSLFQQEGVTSYSQLLFDVARQQVVVGARYV